MPEPHPFPSLPGDWKTPPPAPSRLGISPGLRLGVVFAVLAIVPTAVGARLFQLQVVQSGRYRADFQTLRLRAETIETTRGRILARDGTVLARNEALLTLAVHYRWIENPPNDAWLTRQARQRLTTSERRDRRLVEAARQQVRAEQQELLARLARLTGRPEAEVRRSAREVQDRVEHIWQRVDRQYQQRLQERAAPAPVTLPPDAPWWHRTWDTVVDAVSAPPEPEETSPVLIAEQEMFHPVIDDVSRAAMAEVEAHPDQYSGVQVVHQSRRVYPEGALACHVLGYLGRVSPQEQDRAASAARTGEREEQEDNPYEADDLVGRMGVEASYESVLRGRRGRREELVDRRDNVLGIEREIDPLPGRDIQLTLDLELQRETERLFEEAVVEVAEEAAAQSQAAAHRKWPYGAAAVVLDVRTGAVLAIASVPRFDPNGLSRSDAAAWRQVDENRAQPLFNRASAASLPPGSVFKVVSAIAAIQSGLIDPHETFYCQGYLRRPDELRCLVFQKFQSGHGTVDMVEAIKRSCNVYFFHAAERIGPKRLCAWAELLGFGQPTGIDLPGENGGNLPTPANIKQREGHPWWPGDTPRLAIGQALLTATPLQMARLMATVANGGKLVTPHVLAGFGPGFVSDEESDEVLLEGISASKQVPGLSPAALQLVRRGLRDVVEEGGTAHHTVWLESVSVAGKTGTADAGGGRQSHAWFAGYAPADSKPRVAFAVVLEHGGSGGAVAGPVAKRLIEKMVELGRYFEGAHLSARADEP